MAHDNYNSEIPTSNGLLHDAQGCCWEMLSPTQVLTGNGHHIIKKKSTCHGNRKLQRFKRKCRARGLNQEQITILIDQKNDTICEQLSTHPIVNDQTNQRHKRKRDLSKQDLLNSSAKSFSQMTISQQTSKKIKISEDETLLSNTNDNINQSSQNNYTFCKPSKYLKMPRKLLLHSLRLQLNHSLKKKKEQNFILSRLQIHDQQFCLDHICSLYQIYFDQGSKHHMWPVRMKNILNSTIHILIYFSG